MFAWLKREFFHVLPVFLFFAISFTLINWTETFLFRRAGMTPYTLTEVLVAAALIAKVFLLIDHFSFIDLFCNKPLLYSILWKTFFYWMIVIVIRFMIKVAPYLFGGEGFKQDFEAFLFAFDWRLFLSIQGYYVMLLFIFTASREFTRAIGVLKMRKIFLG